VTDSAHDTHDALVWQWLKGAPTSASEFGRPDVATDYALCIYDTSATDRLAWSAAIAGGRTCGTSRPRPCWRATRTGFRYHAPDGIRSIVLHASLEAGRAKIVVSGKGAELGLPSPAMLLPPLRVQLANSDGFCWEATYGASTRFDASSFKAKADPTPSPRPTRAPRNAVSSAAANQP
jgi:hypothetical protein